MLIVEDSSVVRQFLELIVGEDPRLEVAGAVEDRGRGAEHTGPRRARCHLDGYPAARHEWF